MVLSTVRAVRFSKGRRPLQQNTCRFLERVTMAAGIHLFPFRTEKLSPPAPMVLRGRLRGRVGRRPFLLLPSGFRLSYSRRVG
jgi:hypothetical protein